MNTFDGEVKTFRELTIKEWADFITHEVELLLDRKSRNCLICEHFDNASQECRLAGAIPPPKIAVKGCEKFLEQIPF